MKRKLLILMTLYATNSYSQDFIGMDEEEILNYPKEEAISVKELNEFPEIYNQMDSPLRDKNSSSNIYEDPYYTRRDNAEFNLSYTFSTDYEDPTKVQSFDFSYFNQFDNSYQHLWWALQIKATTALYNAIADERVNSTGNSESVAELTREENKQSITTFGLGLGYRFKALAQAFNSNRFFERATAFFNYNTHTDATDQESYNGYGYNADYIINYRSSEAFTYGVKLSYNWVQVQRAANENEKLQDRSLVFGWTSIGFNIGYTY